MTDSMTTTDGSETLTPVKQPFDYLLVLNFNATCQEGSRLPPHQEIIEFPVAKLNTETWDVESRFRQFVRPTTNPELTPFCTELTGISQEMVANQPSLVDVLKNFDAWLHDEGLLPNGKFAFVTCGGWDFKSLLPKEASAKGIPVPGYFSRWINVMEAFAEHRGYRGGGMIRLLKELELPHTGQQHNGMDDVENICRIVRALGGEGHVFDITSGEK